MVSRIRDGTRCAFTSRVGLLHAALCWYPYNAPTLYSSPTRHITAYTLNALASDFRALTVEGCSFFAGLLPLPVSLFSELCLHESLTFVVESLLNTTCKIIYDRRNLKFNLINYCYYFDGNSACVST